MTNKLSVRIKQELRLTMYEFCEKHLNTDYRTFQYRMRRRRYYPAEVIYICFLLNDTCLNIFGESFSDLVLLRDGPGVTVEYINQKLQSADKKERDRLMELIGFSIGEVNAIVPPPEKIKPVEVKPSVNDFIAPSPKKEVIEVEEEPQGFSFIDINLKTKGDQARYGR